MKVVSVLTSPSRGGAEFAAVNLLDALAGRGHECVLVSDLEGIVRDTRVAQRPVALGPKLGLRTWPRLLATWPLLRRRLRAALEAEAPYDVLLVHFKKEQLLVPGLPRRLRPVVAWCEWGPVPFPLRTGLPGRRYAAAGRGAGVVLAVSPGTRDTVVAAGVPAERVHVVPNVVDPAAMDADPAAGAALRAELGIPPEAFVVSCISRFNHKKRNDVLVEAMVRLGGEAHLVLAGEGETEAALRAAAAPLGPRAHFLPTPWDRTPQVMSAADVVAFCPSPTEGQPLAVVNGMLCRRPVVASAAEGVAGLLGDGAGAVAEPEHDPAALAALLADFRDDPERRVREGEAGRARAAQACGGDAVAATVERLLRAAGAPG